jgi:Domain of unknown function (DUF4262)
VTDDVFPDRDMDHVDKLAWVIETQGWVAEPVAPVEDPPTPGYTYSIGFEDSFGFPDLVIFGLAPVAARGLLEMVATHLEAGGEIPVGTFVGFLDNDLPAAVFPVQVSDYLDLFPDAAAYYARDDFRIRQFLWPDKHGRFPWDGDYDERLLLAQPVIATTE